MKGLDVRGLQVGPLVRHLRLIILVLSSILMFGMMPKLARIIFLTLPSTPSPPCKSAQHRLVLRKQQQGDSRTRKLRTLKLVNMTVLGSQV